jgi:hypothetical protein
MLRRLTMMTLLPIALAMPAAAQDRTGHADFPASGSRTVPGPGQVATRVIPPPWKNPAAVQYENAACTRAANGVVSRFVLCMEQRGYRVEVSGPGGVPTSVAQLPYPQQGMPSGAAYARGQALANAQMHAPAPNGYYHPICEGLPSDSEACRAKGPSRNYRIDFW